MIVGVGHVAIRVTDIERARAFYCGTMGLREAFHLDRRGVPSPWIVYLQAAPGQFVELFPDAAGPANGEEGRAGYDHLCLAVDDLRETLRDLESHGLTIEGKPEMGLDGNWQYWVHDPDGNAIELMEIAPASPHAEADRTWDKWVRSGRGASRA